MLKRGRGKHYPNIVYLWDSYGAWSKVVDGMPKSQLISPQSAYGYVTATRHAWLWGTVRFYVHDDVTCNRFPYHWPFVGQSLGRTHAIGRLSAK